MIFVRHEKEHTTNKKTVTNHHKYKGISIDLVPIKAAIHQDFLPVLFSRSTPITINYDLCCLLGHSVKMGSIGIHDPTQVADHLFATSQFTTSFLVDILVAGANFLVETHSNKILSTSAQLWKDHTSKKEEFVEELALLNWDLCHHLNAAKESGTWLTTLWAQLNGMQLSPQEFQDAF